MRKNILSFKIKYACFIIGFIFFINHAKSSPVDSLTAKTVAVNFYAQNFGVTAPTGSLVHTEKSADGETEYYIYNVSPVIGFVIVCAEDAAHPILGYSAEGYYSATHLSPEFVFWMKRYKKQIESIRLNKLRANVEIQNEWFAYKNSVPLKTGKKLTSSVTPLVKTVWAQEPYFNADCPGGDVAGCVATSMGQIMKYWSYPPHGIGSHSYTDNPYGSLYANFDTTHYDWAAMPLNVTSNNSHVATLMYNCGVSVEMQYTLNSSGSYMISADNPPSGVSAQTAFVRYFGYNGSTIQGLYMNNYSSPDWISMLENELNNGRPLFYAGSGDSGSHAWVCDGYDVSGDFHMNWGWLGYEDGYFTLNALNPDNYSFNSDEEALIGIEPNAAIADFYASPIIIREGDTVKFTDNSFGPVPITGWQWSFPGAIATSSALQNPSVIYPVPGVYTVSETVTSSEGSNTLKVNNYINVLANNTVNVYPTLNDGSFTVQLHDASLASSNLQFSLYDFLGRKIYSTVLQQYITQVNVSVPHGIYFFRADDASGKFLTTGVLVMK